MSMKHPRLSGPRPFRAFWGLVAPFRALLHFGPGPISGPPFGEGKDPHDFIVQPDPWKESRIISQAGVAVKQSNSQTGLAARRDSLMILLHLKRSKS